MSSKAVIVFVKNPEAGRVKTRLQKDLGAGPTIEVYRQLVDYTLSIVSGLSDTHVFVYFDRFIPDDFPRSETISAAVQQGASLGERMQRAFEAEFARGFERVVIIGSDCPEITTEHIERAFGMLNVADVAIGPARDGGYYLLGMKRVHPELFRDKTWSTSEVYAATMRDIRTKNLNYGQLPELNDLDTIEDYRQFRHLFETG